MANLLKQFAFYYVLVLLGTSLIMFALVYFLEYEPNSSFGAVLSVITGMIVGQQYARNHDELPSSGTMWQFAVFTFPIALIISLIFSYGVGAIAQAIAGGIHPLSIFFEVPFWVVLMGVVFIGILHILAVRFCFSMGAKQILKAKAKQNAQ